MNYLIKGGLFVGFTWGVRGTVSSSETLFTLRVLHFSISMATTVDFIVWRIGPKWSTSNSAIGTNRDTWKSIVGARDREKRLKVNYIPELETGPWTPRVKLVNSPFK